MVNSFVTVNERLGTFFDWEFSPKIFMSVFCMILVVVLMTIIGIKARKANIHDKPKGLLLLGVMFYNLMDNLTVSMMSNKHRGFTGMMMGVSAYLFIAFVIGLTGLPSPLTNIAVPLSLGLLTFFFIHFTAVKYNHWAYFKRYIDPIPILLPVNLLSMWAPLLSLSLRLFGNALSGYCIMSLIYYSLEGVSRVIFGGSFGDPLGPTSMLITPIATPILHLYFDMFSGFIQTTVFTMLTLIFIANEQNDNDEAVINEVLETR